MGFLRNPKTTQERRHVDGLTRPKRRNLPTSWDDIIVPTTRSWKKHRKTQYKVTDKAWVWDGWADKKKRRKDEKVRTDGRGSR